MTFGEMKVEVFRRLREASDAPVFWQDEDIAEAINEGYMELSDETEWYEPFEMVALLDNQPLYDARTLFPHPFLRAGAAYNVTTTRWLIPTSYAELDKSDRRWPMRIEEPAYFCVRGLWWLCYWPFKGLNSGTVKQYYRALPPPLVAYEDEPGFHTSHHYALVEFALADLYAQDAETDLATQHLQRYMEYELKMTGQTGNRLKTPLMQGADDEV